VTEQVAPRYTRARVLRWTLTALAVALLVRLAMTVAWHDVWEAARTASPRWLIAAALVNLLTPAVRGTRWWLFLRAAGSPSLTLAIHAAYVGSGLNNVLPASGGDAARALLVARRSIIPAATALATLAVDRVVELATYLALILAIPLFIVVPEVISRGKTIAAITLGALGVAGVIAARRARHRATDRHAHASHGRLRAHLSRFITGLVELPSPRRVAPAVGLSLVAWGIQAVTYHLVALATGLPASFAESTVVMLAVNLSFLMPLTPGNVGVFQAVYAVTMTALGVPSSAAVATALLIQALQILPMTAVAAALAPDLALREGSERSRQG
jgi:uncharacterized protein (TIRG00374 family)